MVAVQVAVGERMVAVHVAVVGQSSFVHTALFRSAGKKRHFLDIDNCNQCKSSFCPPALIVKINSLKRALRVVEQKVQRVKEVVRWVAEGYGAA